MKVPAISKYLVNIYESGELERSATVSEMETVRQEGHRKVKRVLEYYNLDAIIAVGYHANSTKPHMGLTTWKNALKGKILKSDSRTPELNGPNPPGTTSRAATISTPAVPKNDLDKNKSCDYNIITWRLTNEDPDC